MQLGTAARDIAAQLTAAGVPTVTDPRNLVPPAAWLVPALFDYDRLDARACSAEWELYLIAPDTEPDAALDHLGALLDLLRAVVPVGEATPLSLQLRNQSPDGLPALLVRLTTEISED